MNNIVRLFDDLLPCNAFPTYLGEIIPVEEITVRYCILTNATDL